MKQRKKLIEVALPLDAINQASAREKSIRHGHPSTLHLWWARRPLAAARAVIFAQMVDDPSAVPEEFPTPEAQEAERQRLFRLIEELVQWENTTNEEVLQRARAEIWKSWRRTCKDRSEWREVRSESWTAEEIARDEALFDPEKLPAFHDPFAGGGTLPLEAQRLGLEAYASDLNPVAVLINKAMIEIPPRFAGRPPVNPEARSEWRGVRGERSEGRGVRSERGEIGGRDALPGDDPLEEGDGSSARSVSAGAAPAEGGDLRDALADHQGSSLGSGEHSRGLDTRNEQGQGAVPGNRTGVPGGGGDASDPLRGTGLVSDIRDEAPAFDSGRGESHVDNDAAQTSRKLTSRSSLLFPRSYRGAQGLAEDVRYYGQWMRDEAEKRIGHLYPKVRITPDMVRERPDLKPYEGRELTVIAWIWARTVKSPNPAFAQVDVPLASTFMLSTKKGKEAYVEPVIEGDGYRFTVKVGKPKDPAAAKRGTKLSRGANFQCLMSGTPIAPDYIKAEGKAGRMGARLMAIVAEGNRERVYLAPTPEHEAAAREAKPEWKPETPLAPDPRALWTPPYGLTTYGDLFTPRQLVALTTFSNLVAEAMERVRRDALEARREWRGVRSENNHPLSSHSSDLTPLAQGGAGARAYAEAVGVYLAFALSRSADRGSTICSWDNSPKMEALRNTFGRQAIPMVWDFAEGNPFSESSGNWMNNVEWGAKAVMDLPASAYGDAQQADGQGDASAEHGARDHVAPVHVRAQQEDLDRPPPGVLGIRAVQVDVALDQPEYLVLPPAHKEPHGVLFLFHDHIAAGKGLRVGLALHAIDERRPVPVALLIADV